MKWQIQHFDVVQSTNETAKNFPANTVIVASCQTGGKGRLGRVWESPKGNLYCSIVVADRGNLSPLLAFVAGVAVAESLADFHPALKWPNDILIDGKKCAGLLLERTESSIIIGIGLNLISAPTKGMLYQTTHLNKAILPEDILNLILEKLSAYLTLFDTQGFGPVREKWLSYAVGINKSIQVNLPTKKLQGIFKEMSPQGELVLELPDKRVQNITAGDVFIL